MLSSSHHPGNQRCPSCGSRVAIDAATCPICGHEFPPTQLITAHDETDITHAASAQRAGFILAQLPWGVIGVVAVILGLAIGAMLLLRKTAVLAPPASGIRLTIEGTQAAVKTGQATATPTPSAQASATKTTVLPTSVPPPPTLTPVPPIDYVVKSGDTCGGIATDFDVPLSVFAAFNKLDPNDCMIRAGDTVKIPPPTPTAGPSPTLPPGVTAPPGSTPEATVTLPPQIIIQVKANDTCSDIAVRNHVSVALIIQQNGLDADCTLQIGQVLTVTFATPTPFITPTPIVAQTPTPRIGFDAPQVLGPYDGAQISETEDVVTLQWLSVGLLKDNEWYVVQVQPSGAITAPIFETRATSIKITRAIFGDQPERTFAWWVQVKQFMGINAATSERTYTLLSPPSSVHRFTWRMPPVTVTAVPQ